MNYYGEGVYMTDLLIYCPEGIEESLLEERVKATKQQFSLWGGEEVMVLMEDGCSWIGIDCDGIHQQCSEGILKQCMDIWEYPVMMYDVFDEDVLILGYGDLRNKVWSLSSTDGSLYEDLSTEFPETLLPFFEGEEEKVNEIWEEEMTFEGDKLLELGALMIKAPIPEYMLGKWGISDLPESVRMLVL